MPLDGHSYLVSQGWGGQGTGLREGAISRPLAIAQKKNLAGLGKDRDEAFPFWDHLFSAAAKSIVVKCLSDEEDATESSSSTEVTIKRTSTGIFSTRRPTEGTPATSGDVTPDDSSATPRLSLMANAKRDAARRGLYSRFFKGPVLGPEAMAEEERRLTAMVSEAFAKQSPCVEKVKVTEHIEVQTVAEQVPIDLEVSQSSRKKRKAKTTEDSESEGESDVARRERKKRRREKKARKEEKREKKEESNKSDKISKKNTKLKSPPRGQDEDVERGSSHSTQHAEDFDSEGETKAERKRRKEEKKKLKASRKGETTTDPVNVSHDEEKPHRSKSKSKDKIKEKKPTEQSSLEKAHEVTTKLDTEDKRKKKRRKRTHTTNDEN